MGLTAVTSQTTCLIFLVFCAITFVPSSSVCLRDSQSRNSHTSTNPPYSSTNPQYSSRNPPNSSRNPAHSSRKQSNVTTSQRIHTYHTISSVVRTTNGWIFKHNQTSYGSITSSKNSTNPSYKNVTSISVNSNNPQSRNVYTSTKPPHTSTNSPYTSKNLPYTSTILPYMSTKPPYTSENSPYTSTKSPYTSTNSPYTSTNLPYTFTNSPYTSTNSPYTSTNLPYTSTNSPYTSTTSSNRSTIPLPTSAVPSDMNVTSDLTERVYIESKSTTPQWCGSTNPEPTPDSQEDGTQNRIIFGNDTQVYRHPYQLALEGGGSHICGGSILSEYWALTAAHCVYDRAGKWLAFRAGSSQREEGGTIHRVKYYVYHDRFRMETLDYDVAVVFVIEPFVYDSWTLPVNLNLHPYNGGDMVVATGWGYKQRALLTKPKQLQSADFLTLDWGTCRSRYPRQITKRMMCAEDPKNKTDICSGDSGGALVLRGTRTLVGIVSWSYSCADGRPSVYTDVFSVASWIRNKVC